MRFIIKITHSLSFSSPITSSLLETLEEDDRKHGTHNVSDLIRIYVIPSIQSALRSVRKADANNLVYFFFQNRELVCATEDEIDSEESQPHWQNTQKCIISYLDQILNEEGKLLLSPIRITVDELANLLK